MSRTGAQPDGFSQGQSSRAHCAVGNTGLVWKTLVQGSGSFAAELDRTVEKLGRTEELWSVDFVRREGGRERELCIWLRLARLGFMLFLRDY